MLWDDIASGYEQLTDDERADYLGEARGITRGRSRVNSAAQEFPEYAG